MHNITAKTQLALSPLLISIVALIARGEAAFDYNLYESPPKPAPAWVKMVDLGERDPALKGYRAPAGVKVEIVAQEPDVINPVAFRFAEDGTLMCLEWRVGRKIGQVDGTLTFKDGSSRPDQLWTKDVPDDLTTLSADTYGSFHKTGVVMNDLRLPSSVLIHDGWHYFTTRGSVVRRKQSQVGEGKPFDVQETMLHGLAGFNQHQASGLTLAPDGWLYVTNGDDDSHAESADGTRVDLLRNGAVWRMRPDGSQLSLFAHGFRNPYRDVAIDSFGNIFHTDNDNEDGSKFQGCRLIHLMEEADYGWRLHPGVRCCWPDHDRGAIFGELPGRMAPMVKTGRGAPCGVLLYQGVGFPAFFGGLIVYPDVFQRNVRCYGVERDGSTFKVVSQFTLLETTDGYFRPCQALQGPDGSIYLCDWRSNSAGPGAAWGDGKHGRIWRLSWEGTPDAPAIVRGAVNAWIDAKAGDSAALLARLDSEDYEVRIRALDAIVLKGEAAREGLLSVARDIKRPLTARAAAIFGLSRLWNDDVEKSLLALLEDNSFEIQKIVIEAYSNNASRLKTSYDSLNLVMAKIGAGHPAVRRAAALAVTKLAHHDSADEQARVADLLVKTLQSDSSGDRFLHDGLIRAIERLGRAGFDRLITSARSDGPEAIAIPTLEACRSREAADAITKVLELSAVTDAQAARLLTAYRYIQVEPAIDPAPISRWLDAHPTAPAPTQVAAIESLALIGEMDSTHVMPVIERLLKNPDAATRLAAAKVIGEQHLLAAANLLAVAAKDSSRSIDERRVILSALGGLRGQKRFAQIEFDPGVDAHGDDLLSIATDASAGELKHDALALLAQIDFKKAKPLAEKMLDEPAEAPAAINILGADAGATRQVAQRFIDEKLPVELLPQVSSALQRQMTKAYSAELADLRTSVMKRGLLISTDPAGIKRVEDLVRAHGNADRGRALYLNRAKLVCVTCHRLEGYGGQVGPDLTNLYQNSTVPKLIESILEPSKEIKEGYETWVVQTKSGESYDGLKVSSDAQRFILRDATGRTITIPADSIKRMAASKVSLMPEGLTATLTLDDFADLLAFLADGKAQSALRGMKEKP